MNKAKSRILAHSHPATERLVRHRWLVAGVGAFSFLGMMTAFATISPTADSTPLQLQTVLEQLTPQAALIPAEENTVFLREEQIQRSDTLSSLLSRLGVTEREALELDRKSVV